MVKLGSSFVLPKPKAGETVAAFEPRVIVPVTPRSTIFEHCFVKFSCLAKQFYQNIGEQSVLWREEQRFSRMRYRFVRSSDPA